MSSGPNHGRLGGRYTLPSPSLYSPRKDNPLDAGSFIAYLIPDGHRLCLVRSPASGAPLFPHVLVRFRPAPVVYGKLLKFCVHASPAFRHPFQFTLSLHRLGQARFDYVPYAGEKAKIHRPAGLHHADDRHPISMSPGTAYDHPFGK